MKSDKNMKEEIFSGKDTGNLFVIIPVAQYC